MLARMGQLANLRFAARTVCFVLYSEPTLIFLQLILGRQKLKKSLQYEIKWRGLDHKFNTWIPREELLAKGFTKLVQQFDDLEASREGAGARDTSAHLVRKHLEDIGLDGDIAQYNEISGLSGGRWERTASTFPV